MARKNMIAALLLQVAKDETIASFDPLGATVAAAMDWMLLGFDRTTATWAVLPAGRAFLAKIEAAKTVARAKARRAARGRAAAMQGIGMRRTAGGWE